jgi:hypothetical protein
LNLSTFKGWNLNTLEIETYNLDIVLTFTFGELKVYTLKDGNVPPWKSSRYFQSWKIETLNLGKVKRSTLKI